VQTAAQSYNAANQVVGWNYDAAGNLLGYGAGDVYAYDGLGRMTSQDGTLMQYNGDGVLVQAGATVYTQDLVAPLSQVLGETRGGEETRYHLALALGLRRGELVALRWADIDLDGATLTVQGGKTAAARRTLPLSAALVERLREHWRRQQQERAALPLTWQEHGRVFASEVGTPMQARNVYRHFKQLAQRAGLPDTVTFHDLRHTALTRLAERGTPPAVVQAIAGHTTPGLALQVYTHADLNTLRAAIG
jgi:YD repeat-containing protein